MQCGSSRWERGDGAFQPLAAKENSFDVWERQRQGSEIGTSSCIAFDRLACVCSCRHRCNLSLPVFLKGGMFTGVQSVHRVLRVWDVLWRCKSCSFGACGIACYHHAACISIKFPDEGFIATTRRLRISNSGANYPAFGVVISRQVWLVPAAGSLPPFRSHDLA